MLSVYDWLVCADGIDGRVLIGIKGSCYALGLLCARVCRLL